MTVLCEELPCSWPLTFSNSFFQIFGPPSLIPQIFTHGEQVLSRWHFSHPSSGSFLGQPGHPQQGVRQALGSAHAQASGRRRKRGGEGDSTLELGIAGQLESLTPEPSRGLGTISFRRKADELLEPNLMELRYQCWAETMSLSARRKKGPGEMDVGNRVSLSISHLYFRMVCSGLGLI